jgi:hypothetical protein
MTDRGYFAELTESLGGGWNRFWFAPSDPLPCSVLRVAVGLLVIAHLLSLTAGLDRWYARDGLLSPGSVRVIVAAETDDAQYHFSLLGSLGSWEARIVHGLAIAVAAAFAVGLFARFTGLLTMLALLGYFHRLPLVAGHVEPVLIFLVAYLSLGPVDAYCSLGRWLRNRTAAESLTGPPQPSFWATLSLRLIQVHLAAFIAMMGLAKLSGDAWWTGQAVWYLLAQTHSRPLDLTALRDYPLLVNFWTHAIVYYELAFPVLVWNRLARPIVLAVGAILWLWVILATGLLLFGLTMTVATLAFIPASTYRRLLNSMH